MWRTCWFYEVSLYLRNILICQLCIWPSPIQQWNLKRPWPSGRLVQHSSSVSTCLLTHGSRPFSSSNLTCNFTLLYLSFLFIFSFRANTDPCIRTHLANRADAVRREKKNKKTRSLSHSLLLSVQIFLLFSLFGRKLREALLCIFLSRSQQVEAVQWLWADEERLEVETSDLHTIWYDFGSYTNNLIFNDNESSMIH